VLEGDPLTLTLGCGLIVGEAVLSDGLAVGSLISGGRLLSPSPQVLSQGIFALKETVFPFGDLDSAQLSGWRPASPEAKDSSCK